MSKRRTILSVFAIIIAIPVVLYVGNGPLAATCGELAARRDIAHGRYLILGYGLPSPARADYIRILKARYGIEFHAVAGCIVSPGLVGYVRGYDGVSEEAIRSKFGPTVLEDAGSQADTVCKTRDKAIYQDR
jgi:hypothetical protein